MLFRRYLYLSLIPVLLAATGCTPSEKQSPPEELVKTVNVETTEVEPQLFERFLRLVGTVESQNDVLVSAEVAGRIENYLVGKGERVRKNQTIAKIDDAQLLREKERLEALTEQSRENFQRLERIYKQDKIGSEMDYLNAKYTYQQNRAALEAVKVSLDKTTVKAPFEATVERKMVEEGEMVSPGVPMARLIGLNRLKITAGVPSRFSGTVHTGDPVQVWFDFENSDTLNYPITFVGQSIDKQARTFEIEVTLPDNSANEYKVDMVANLMVRTLVQEDAIVVSHEYIYQKDNSNVVYIAEENSDGDLVAREQPVILGKTYRNDVVVETGLNPGDRLITVGSAFLEDNMRITIVNNSNQSLAEQKLN
ncbi:MAG: efflux RND transporter periplasmic adaptor subunit [Balneolaceae bacterium]|nr:efflux RND transporter periplasmic adaptor subunit [Balneolaceae bacterium]